MFSDRSIASTEPDAELLSGEAGSVAQDHRVAVGDVVAFEQVVRLHSSRVFNFVYQMTRQRQDAEDLVQQTFVKAYHNLHRFDGSRPIINWLLTIARRSALNHFRSAKRWEEVPETAASSDPTPAINAENREEKETLWTSARRLLPQREFEILWLRFGEDLSIEETARVAGLTQTHIKVIVYRARKRLMKAQLR
ncbi:MAG: sigma-70 family RNA polymerase sigma factor [Opitutus sp.]